ncbi:MAG: GIY-YIG nuclease family protein [Clostridia bacterium]|nr:GIY-YIG nuclease family protein [Clostridia bacterium]
MNEEITNCDFAFVSVNGEVYRIPRHIVEYLEHNGVRIDDNYINHLKKYLNIQSAFNKPNVCYLIYCDYHNRVLFSKDKGLGNIYEYDESGTFVNHYSSVFDAAKNSMPESIFGFERLDSQAKTPYTYINKTFDFYGKRFERYVCVDDSVYSFIFKELNRAIRRIRYYLFNSRPTQTDKALYYSYIEADSIHSIVRGNPSSEKVARKMLSFDEYSSAILPLNNRYSYKNNDLVSKVDDLGKVDYPGIYILCFDAYRGYYIGQAKTSIMQRIIQHFKQPNSSFDMLYGANEVSAIYAIPYVSDETLMDELEADCISLVSPGFLLNSMPNSGKSLGLVDSIHDVLYNPMEFRMSNANYEKAIKTIFMIKSNDI